MNIEVKTPNVPHGSGGGGNRATQDRTDTLDGIAVGQTITAHFNLRGKLTQDKNGNPTAWTNLDVWKVAASSDTPAAGDPVTRPVQQTFDDVPF